LSNIHFKFIACMYSLSFYLRKSFICANFGINLFLYSHIIITPNWNIIDERPKLTTDNAICHMPTRFRAAQWKNSSGSTSPVEGLAPDEGSILAPTPSTKSTPPTLIIGVRVGGEGMVGESPPPSPFRLFCDDTSSTVFSSSPFPVFLFRFRSSFVIFLTENLPRYNVNFVENLIAKPLLKKSPMKFVIKWVITIEIRTCE